MKSYTSNGKAELTICAQVALFLGEYLGASWKQDEMMRAVNAWYGDYTVREEKVKDGFSRDKRKAGEILTPCQSSHTKVHARSVVGEFWAWQDRVESFAAKAAKAEKDGISASVSVVKLPEGNGFAAWLENWREAKADAPKQSKSKQSKSKVKVVNGDDATKAPKYDMAAANETPAIQQ
jgi:hypothetical protein